VLGADDNALVNFLVIELAGGQPLLYRHTHDVPDARYRTRELPLAPLLPKTLMHCATFAPELSAIFNIVSCCIIFCFPSIVCGSSWAAFVIMRTRRHLLVLLYGLHPVNFNHVTNTSSILLIVNSQPGPPLERLAILRMPVHVIYGNLYGLAAALAYLTGFLSFLPVFLHPSSLTEALLFLALFDADVIPSLSSLPHDAR